MVTMTGAEPVRVTVQRVSTGGQVAGLFQGDGDPSEVPQGAPVGVAYLNRLTGDIFQLGVDMEWQPVANVKGPKGTAGPSGDGVLSQAELDALAAEIEEGLTPPVDLLVGFENVLAGP